MISGYATANGTRRFAARFNELAPGHFRAMQDLVVSSIGLGTFGGDDDDRADESYEAAITAALALGCNVFDSAVPYRHQRSERTIGRTLSNLTVQNKIQRDQIVISTKAGFIPYDSTYRGEVRQYFEDTYVKPGIFNAADVVANRHCLAPKFLKHQIDASRQNLNCETIDIYYLHNPETQLQSVDRREFLSRMRKAFEVLEGGVADGKIGFYGVSTWDGFRLPANSRTYLSVTELVRCATEVGGMNHHFRAIMLPLSISQPEGYVNRNQRSPQPPEWVSTLTATQHFGLSVTISSSLDQGRLANVFPKSLSFSSTDDFRTNAQKALQLIRSVPGVATALVGMSIPGHVRENLEIAGLESLPERAVAEFFADCGRVSVAT